MSATSMSSGRHGCHIHVVTGSGPGRGGGIRRHRGTACPAPPGTARRDMSGRPRPAPPPLKIPSPARLRAPLSPCFPSSLVPRPSSLVASSSLLSPDRGGALSARSRGQLMPAEPGAVGEKLILESDVPGGRVHLL